MSVSPNTTGLPGLSELSSIVGAMLTVGAILCVLGVILSSIVWATASTSGNVQLVARAKTGTVVCAIAALLIGGSSLLITFFVNAGTPCEAGLPADLFSWALLVAGIACLAAGSSACGCGDSRGYTAIIGASPAGRADGQGKTGLALSVSVLRACGAVAGPGLGGACGEVRGVAVGSAWR